MSYNCSISVRRCRLTAVALLCGATVIAADGARGADMPDDFFLRGAIAAPVAWEGFVVGGQIGASNLNADFSDSTNQLVAHLLRQSTLQNEAHPSDWDVLGSKNATAMSYGGFIGYNWQLDDLVLGIDAGYNRLSNLQTSDGWTTLSRVTTTSDGTANALSITARSTLKMKDYATLRGRVGYGIGQFLPYAFLGAAVGRFDYATTASVFLVQTPSGGTPSTYSPPAESSSKTNQYQAGFVTGLGVDIALLPNMFLRAEWEYAAFGELKGIRPSMNTGRVGLALRF